MSQALPPQQIKVKGGSGCLELSYADQTFDLSFEFLRVHSPSAEVRGHGVGSEVLQYGKKFVVLDNIEPVGNYGIKLIFSDKHDSGIYTWATLREYCDNQQSMWESYLSELALAGKTREP